MTTLLSNVRRENRSVRKKTKNKIDMRKLMLIVAMAIGMVACHDERIDLTGKGDCGSKETVGYISFAGDGLSVSVDNEATGGDVEPMAVTRASGTDKYTVEIWAEGGDAPKYTFLYKDFTTHENYTEGKGIEVPVGNYVVKAYSAPTPKVSFKPEYAGEDVVQVTKNAVAQADIECKLSSVKVSVRFDPILASLISDDTKSRVVLGQNNTSEYTFEGRPVIPNVTSVPTGCETMDWGYADVDNGVYGYVYLRPNEQVNPLTLYLTTTYNGNAINNQALPVPNATDAKPGEWRKITVKLENGENGTIYFNITVETWADGEVVDCDTQVVASSMIEASIPDDSDAPKIEWVNHDLAETFVIDDSMFDAEGNFSAGALFNVTAKKDITSFKLGVKSDNSDIASLGLDVEGGVEVGSMATLTKMLIGSWGFPISISASQTAMSFDLKAMMKDLHTNYTGNHTFTITVTDAGGSVTSVELKITSGAKIDPNIVWVGKQLDTPYELKSIDEIKVVVTADNLIENIFVEINGPLADELGSMYMPRRFGLKEPGTFTNGEGDLSVTLNGFGFPTGYDNPETEEKEGIYGHNEVSFTITSDLMELMSGFYTASEKKEDCIEFKITVIDQSNPAKEVTKSILLHNIKK